MANLGNSNLFRIMAQVAALFPNCHLEPFRGKNAPNAIMFVAKFQTQQSDENFTIVTPFGVAITGFQKSGTVYTFTLFVLDIEAFCNYYEVELVGV